VRITNNTLINNMLRQLNSGLGRLGQYQEQLASGRRVLKPSDDPAGIVSISQLKTSLFENQQLLSNVDSAYSWLDSADTVLASVTSVMHRAKELTIYAATEVLSDSDRYAIQEEMKQLFDNVLQLANSTHSGRYLFGGQKTTTVPFTRESLDPNDPNFFNIVYQGGRSDDGTASQSLEINANSVLDLSLVQTKVNADGKVEDSLFMPILSTFRKIIADMEQGNVSDLSSVDIEQLESALDNVLSYRAVVGAKVNRVQMAKERLQELKINFNQLLSNAQDIDVAETIMQLKSEEYVYRTALAVGARIIQPSLVDFLK